MYIVLGCLISFGTGREPGTLPDNVLKELAPTTVVLAVFLTYYELADCMGVGISKGTSSKNKAAMLYNEYSTQPIPEQVYLAQRVQTNQIEQMPVMIVGAVLCAIYVNGWTAGIMSLLWALLRIQYSQTYRSACVGLKYKDVMSRIGKFTVPAYFVCNSMLMAAAVHAVRTMLI